MRKREKSQRNYGILFISIFIALIMITSIAGFLIGSNQDKITFKYNNFRFNFKDNMYYTKIDGEVMSFQFSPTDVEDIELSEDASKKLKESGVRMLTFNPDNEERQIVDNLRLYISDRIPMTFSAVTYLSDYYPSLKVVTCDNITKEVGVIYIDNSFNYTNNTIDFLQDCIIMKGSGQSLFQLADRIIYAYYGVIK